MPDTLAAIRSASTSPRSSLLSLAHQISYVTDDVDAFVERLRDRFGVQHMTVRHDHSRSSPLSSGAILHMALAWIDDVMIEVIQPHPDKPSIYGDSLNGREGGVGALHHIGLAMTQFAEWEEGERMVSALGLPVEITGGAGPLRYSYPDARPGLGHYLEFSYKEAGQGAVDMPVNRSDMTTGPLPLLGGFFQRGSVVRDIDAAMAHLGKAYGVTNWSIMRNRPGSGRMTRHIALAWTGSSMIELIEPDDSVAHIYEGARPGPGQVARFHHLGFLLPDDIAFDAVDRRLEALGISVVVRGQVGKLRYLYADARADLGHYLEYFSLGGERSAMFDAVPHN